MQPEKKKTLIDDITKLSMHRDPHKLSDLLDVVEIVLGFLASAGGKPDQTFHNYITRTLTMQRAHIPKVHTYAVNGECNLISRVYMIHMHCSLQSCNWVDIISC